MLEAIKDVYLMQHPAIGYTHTIAVIMVLLIIVVGKLNLIVNLLDITKVIG